MLKHFSGTPSISNTQTDLKNYSIHVLGTRLGAHLMGSGQDLNNSVFTGNDVCCLYCLNENVDSSVYCTS